MLRFQLLLLLLSLLISANISAQIHPLYPLDNSVYVNVENDVLLRLERSLNAKDKEEVVKSIKITSHDSSFNFSPVWLPNKLLLKINETFPFEQVIEVSLKCKGVPLDYSFTTAKPNSKLKGTASFDLKANVDLPDDFPSFTMNISEEATYGNLVLANWLPPSYPMIINAEGEVIDFISDFQSTQNFYPIENGTYSLFLRGQKIHVLLDDSLNITDTLRPLAGFAADGHDLLIKENGNRLFMIYNQQVVDMSEIVEGGNPNASVTGLVLQELDVDGNLLFQWASWDHFEFTDAVRANLTNEAFSYVHGNSIEFGPAGNIIISCRAMDELTKISYETGEIIWRLGGKNNEFLWINDDDQLNAQHDARWTPEGTLTIFDNGNFRSPPRARGIEIQLDEINKTAEVIYEFGRDIKSQAMGSFQKLSKGNYLINWGLVTEGEAPNLEEIDTNGEVVMDFAFDVSQQIYKARLVELEEEITGINDYTSPFSFRVYPNPADEYITISNPSEIIISQYEILDLQGRLIEHGTFEKQSSRISIDHLLKSYYYLRLFSEDRVVLATEKFLIR